MKAGIITINGREAYLTLLLELLKVNKIEYTLYVDIERNGHMWNYNRMFHDMLSKAKQNEPILLLADDVLIPTDFKNRFYEIHNKARNSLYCFFTRQRHLKKASIINQGYVTSVQKGGWYDICGVFINQQELPKRVDKWYEDIGQHTMTKNWKAHYDMRVQEYLVYYNIPWTISVPTLCEHVGDVSTLNHSIGKSILYVEDYEKITK